MNSPFSVKAHTKYVQAASNNLTTFQYYTPPNCLTAPSRSRPPHYQGFTITFSGAWMHTLGRTPLDKWSA